MLLNDLHAINQLDNEILSLQEQLFQLYKERTLLASKENKQGKAVTQLHSSAPKARQQSPEQRLYQELLHQWSSVLAPHELPAFITVKNRISKAIRTAKNLQVHAPLKTVPHFEIVLVPPTNLLKKSIITNDKRLEAIVDSPAFNQKTHNTWRVFVMYNDTQGLPMNGELFESRNSYTSRKYNLCSLGAQEYCALILQSGAKEIDGTNWSILLREPVASQSDSYWCIKLESDVYRMVEDELESVFNDNRFRPAIEM